MCQPKGQACGSTGGWDVLQNFKQEVIGHIWIFTKKRKKEKKSACLEWEVGLKKAPRSSPLLRVSCDILHVVPIDSQNSAKDSNAKISYMIRDMKVHQN